MSFKDGAGHSDHRTVHGRGAAGPCGPAGKPGAGAAFGAGVRGAGAAVSGGKHPGTAGISGGTGGAQRRGPGTVRSPV